MPRICAATLVAALLGLLMSFVSEQADAESGRASWYALTSRTASGERCNPKAMIVSRRVV
jgi:rare lipoprotein A